MNRTKVYLNGLGRGTRVLFLSLAVIFVGAGIAQATATTIGTNILTTGTLGVTGLSTLGQASTTIFSATGSSYLTGASYFGGTATTTISTAGAIATPSLQVGLTSGTAITQIIKGTCSLVSDASIAATSTGTGTCATVGSLAGDKVFINLATTTTKVAAQYAIVGAVAGTDTTTVRLLNLTGGAAVPSATDGLGSSTQYMIIR